MSRAGQLRQVASGLRKSVDRTTVGTVSTGVLVQFALVLSGIIAARALGPEDRGRLALFQAIAIAGSFIISLGLPTAIAYWTAKDARLARPALASVRGLLTAQFALALVVPAIVLSLEYGGAGGDIALAAAFSWPMTLAVLAGLHISSLLQGLHRFLAFNLFKSLPIAAYALGVLALWVFGVASLPEFTALLSVISIITMIAGVVLLRRGLPASDGASVEGRELVKYGFKSQIGTASPLESFQIDLLVVGAIGGPSVLGLYVGALAFTNLPRFVAYSIGVVAFPRVAATKGKEAMRKSREALLLTFAVLLAIVIPLELLMGWLIPFMFGDAFAGSVPVARVLLISALLLGLRRVLGDVMRGGGAPLPSTAAEIVSWVVYAIAVWPLIASHDTVGAGVAMLLASAASFGWLVASAALILRERRRRPAGGDGGDDADS